MNKSLLKKRQRRTTPQEREQIVELYHKGYSLLSIAEAMGYSLATVYRVIIKKTVATKRKK
jgi:DNA invertase Pin-like site-specific DNA recombinase